MWPFCPLYSTGPIKWIISNLSKQESTNLRTRISLITKTIIIKHCILIVLPKLGRFRIILDHKISSFEDMIQLHKNSPNYCREKNLNFWHSLHRHMWLYTDILTLGPKITRKSTHTMHYVCIHGTRVFFRASDVKRFPVAVQYILIAVAWGKRDKNNKLFWFLSGSYKFLLAWEQKKSKTRSRIIISMLIYQK